MSYLQLAQAFTVLAPTLSGDQAILPIAAGSNVQDLNALWGGVRDRFRDKSGFITVKAEGGLCYVRTLFVGESGGVTAANGFSLVDGEKMDFIVGPANARLDYTIAAGYLKLYNSSSRA